MGWTELTDSEIDELVAIGDFDRLDELMEVEQAEQEVFLDDDEWHAYELFVLLSTQWIRSNGFQVGINYVALEFVARLHEINLTAEVFMLFQTLEKLALHGIHKRRIQASKKK